MQTSQSEVLREIASKLWHAPVGKILQGIDEAREQTKVVLVKTPVGIISVIFLLGHQSNSILIRGNGAGHFLFEMSADNFYDEANKEKQLGEIADMSVDWTDDTYRYPAELH
jgi:hypothetical protein